MMLPALCPMLMSQSALAASGEISRDRAHHLAADYFARYFLEGCGGVASPILRGDHWEAPLRLGAAGTLSGYIRVDRRSGSVWYGRASQTYPMVSAESLEAWAASLKKRSHTP